MVLSPHCSVERNLWYPFTPTFTAAPGQWVGWQDALRFALAGLFLLLLPALFFMYVQVAFSQQPQALSIHLLPPTLSDLLKVIVVLSLVAPQLGFYNIWQVIMRSCPRLFYSDVATRKVEEHYPNAFKAGHGATMAWAFAWIFVPIFAFIVILWFGAK